MTVVPEVEREAQKAYWAKHSEECTMEAMMLDSQAAIIDQQERPEVLSMLGNVEKQRVVELGAGIGRFTGELARTAETVLAVDFMEHLIAENRVVNKRFKNVEWMAADATEMQLPADSCDVVFSNWLLMYLNDAEVTKLATDAILWVREGGIVFCRESCFKQSGDIKRDENPTHYRNPRDYFAIFDGVQRQLPDGRHAHFELVSCKCVDTYVRIKKNQNQICWKLRKVVTDGPRGQLVRSFLDGSQYSSQSIRRYERIYGSGFVSTGGASTTQELADLLQLQPSERVLDVGCGIGGGDFLLASRYGAFVHGIDLSVNMVLAALERAQDQEASQVSFEVADALTAEFTAASYDVVYSRDTFLHVKNKAALFKRLFRVLRPGGRLLISDYCTSEGGLSLGTQKYIQQRGYYLRTLADYAQLLKDAGFESVVAEDRTAEFESCLKRELGTMKEQQADFEADFSAAGYQEVVTGWTDKIQRAQVGEQLWGLFTARKPLNAE